MDQYLHEETRLKMAHRAKAFGIAALASSVILFSIPYIAIGLGFLALMFGILSKGYKPSFDKDAKFGMGLSVVAICIGVGILGSTVYKLYNDTDYRNSILNTIDQFYGEEYEDAYGESFSDMFNEMIGESGDVNL